MRRVWLQSSRFVLVCVPTRISIWFQIYYAEIEFVQYMILQRIATKKWRWEEQVAKDNIKWNNNVVGDRENPREALADPNEMTICYTKDHGKELDSGGPEPTIMKVDGRCLCVCRLKKRSNFLAAIDLILYIATKIIWSIANWKKYWNTKWRVTKVFIFAILHNIYTSEHSSKSITKTEIIIMSWRQHAGRV